MILATTQTRFDSGRQKSRLIEPRHRRKAPPQNRPAARKHASGFFCPAPLKTPLANVTQTLGTHQENAVFLTTTVSGCAVAPNSGGSESIWFSVVTVIRPPHDQAGVKSQQSVRIDPATGQLISAVYSTGVTHLPGLPLPSIRDGFTATSAPTPAGFKVSLSGETATGVHFLPNINYDVQIYYNRTTGIATPRGTHDGYPSYEIRHGDTVIYDFQQENTYQLAGSGDIVVEKP